MNMYVTEQPPLPNLEKRNGYQVAQFFINMWLKPRDEVFLVVLELVVHQPKPRQFVH